MARYDRYGYNRFAAYVSVAAKRARARAEVARRKRKGEGLHPVVIEGRSIARTFWGKAWCRHIEDHCDYDNRLPRGRSYVRHGAVIDLRIERGRVHGLVCGTSTYRVRIEIDELESERWQRLCERSAGHIDSLVALLQGRLGSSVLEHLCDPVQGMFPRPRQLELACTCPDRAQMCKHVAAVLYGVGARLDGEPELLYVLRGVDQADLLGRAAVASVGDETGDDALGDDELGALFGVEMDAGVEPAVAPVAGATEQSGAAKETALATATKKTTWAAARKTTRAATKKTTRTAARKTTRAATKKTTRAATKKTTRAATKKTTRAATKKTTAQAAKKTTRAAAKKTTAQAAKKTTRAATKKTTRAAAKKTTAQAADKTTRTQTGKARGRTRPGRPAGEFALATLGRFAGEEFRIEGIRQQGGEEHSAAALGRALRRLHDKGLVYRTSDEARRVWWEISEEGLARLRAAGFEPAPRGSGSRG